MSISKKQRIHEGPLSETKLRSLKPSTKKYRVSDRDGLYVEVSPTGAISFRFNYRINERQETVTLGQWGVGGISLIEAREKLHEAKRMVREGVSPALTKARAKKRVTEQRSFGTWADEWLEKCVCAESTRELRRSTYERELKQWANRAMNEIEPADVRKMTDAIRGRGAPSTAVAVRNIISHVYTWAADRGQEHPCPASKIKPHTIATFKSRTRNLSQREIGLVYRYMDRAQTSLANIAALKVILLTMVRKGELAGAKWDEFDLDNGIWDIPAERMKNRLPHVVYLSRQAVSLLRNLRIFAGISDYVLPARNDSERHISDATLNRAITMILKAAAEDGVEIATFSPHDLRRTASTQLNEHEYDWRWIEYCLAHTKGNTVEGTYNRAKWKNQRTQMLQDWADMVDQWAKPSPPALKVVTPIASAAAA